MTDSLDDDYFHAILSSVEKDCLYDEVAHLTRDLNKELMAKAQCDLEKIR